jgi:hypothetical protein
MTRKKRRRRPRRYLLMPLIEYKRRVAEAALMGEPSYFETLIKRAMLELRGAMTAAAASIGGSIKLSAKSELIIHWDWLKLKRGVRFRTGDHHDISTLVRPLLRSDKSELQFLERIEYRRRALFRRALARPWWADRAAKSPKT